MAIAFKALYFGLQWLRKEPVYRAIQDLQKTDFASLDELRFLQARRAKQYLINALAYSSYYVKNYKLYQSEAQNVSTYEQIISLFKKLPRLDKEIVRANHSEFISSRLNKIKFTMDTTSGSSGTPLVFPCDNISWAYRHASIFRCFSWFGVSVGDRYVYFFGQHWARKNKFKTKVKDKIFNRLRVSPFDLNIDNTPKYFHRILSFKPKFFYGYPSAIYSFFKYCHSLSIPVHKLNLLGVFTTAEPLLEYQRVFIEREFKIRCINMYGSAEGSNTAFECPAGNLHETIEMTLNLYDEIDNGRSKIFVNDLFLSAFPLINYSLEDDILLSNKVCSCGRAHPVIDKIEGRSGEPIKLPNGKIVNANLPSYIFKNIPCSSKILKYRFYNVNNLKLILLYEALEDLTEYDILKIKHETSLAFGQGFSLQVKRVPKIPNLQNEKHKDYIFSTTDIE